MYNENAELNIITSYDKDYQNIIKNGIRKFNNEKHPEHHVFQLYRDKRDSDNKDLIL